jgi:hypothetical protein
MRSENIHGCIQNAENGLGFDFLQPYREVGDKFLNHIIRVIGDETWVSFVNVETREQSNQWMHTHSPKKPKKIKNRLSARNLVEPAFFFIRKGVLMVELMHNNVKSVLRSTKKTACGHLEKKAWYADVRCCAHP